MEMGALGTRYGFEVRSALPFLYLREGSGDPLEVTAPAPEGEGPEDVLLIEWLATEELPLEARLYSDGRSFRLWIGGGGWFSVELRGGPHRGSRGRWAPHGGVALGHSRPPLLPRARRPSAPRNGRRDGGRGRARRRPPHLR